MYYLFALLLIGFAVLMGYFISFIWLTALTVVSGIFFTFAWMSEMRNTAPTHGTSGRMGGGLFGLFITVIYVMFVAIMWATYYFATGQKWFSYALHTFFSSILR